MLLLWTLLFQGAAAQFCPSGWLVFENNCYLFHNDSSKAAIFSVLSQRCKDVGAVIASGETVAEFKFLDGVSLPEVVAREKDSEKTVCHRMVLGATRTAIGAKTWVKVDGTPYNPRSWCPTWGNDNSKGMQNNVVISSHFKPSCVDDQGLAEANLYRFTCVKPSCSDPALSFQNGKCGLQAGFIDLGNDATKGVRYISKSPCDLVRDKLSVVFITTAGKDAETLSTFLKTSSRLLPTSTRVGFLKHVSYSNWLESGWAEADYNKKVPTSVSEGPNNKAEALDKSREMFKTDSTKNKVAVLIAEGIAAESQAATKDAVKKLTDGGVSLIAMGYGKGQDKGLLKRLVQTEEDYFDFTDDASKLTETPMSILLSKVCRRFV